ncbi:MAG: UDP-N-acetylglucosamine:LPS N-acetylglucosamine transferase-like protein [Actinomycetia bacterium]|nr:UDP-N-acetylglucosamine:LPS N-acetylglucosamine transferase-like protein [Actinomycetes bacterium]
MTTRKVLILSGHFGKGHDTVAEATATALAPLDVECRTVDSIDMLGPAAGQAGDRVFRSILSVPPLYDALHFSQLRPGGRLADLMDWAAVAAMYPHFLEIVREFPPDLVVSVFATGAGVASRYKASHPDLITAVFITDAYAHRLWVHAHTDIFLTTSEVGARSVEGLRPRARVAVVTHPTRPAFYAAPDRASARAGLGVPDDARCVLLMSGGWGIGPLAKAATAVARAGIWVLAVAGNNERLERQLRRASAADRRIVAFGYTDRVPELMAASDAVITSSGDTCREARVVGRPLILTDVVPGHGRENLMHELELGGATVTTMGPRSLVATVEDFLDHPPAMPALGDPDRWERELRGALAPVGFA